MATLTGNKIKDSYKGLIKTTDNTEIAGEKQLTDGDGNSIPMTVSTTSVGFSADVKDNAGSVGTAGQTIRKTGAGVLWEDRTFVFNQTVSTPSWVVAHSMNCFPSVVVIDSVGNEVQGDVVYTDANNITITFKVAFKGRAYLN